MAAAWCHPSTCKQLLEHGADGSMLIQDYGISWYVIYQCSQSTDGLLIANPRNALGLAAEYAGYYRIFLFSGLEEHRPKPTESLGQKRETMRILTDHNSCDLHQGYEPGKNGYWNGSRSALHQFRGTSKDFLWLSKRDEAFMAIRDSDDYISSVVLQQTQMFPNDSFSAAFSQVSNIEHLANYRDSSGSSLLHYLLNTNFGTEPGIWMNGVDIFNFVKTLLEHGADPTARDNQGNTPLMDAAKSSLRYFLSHGLSWTVETAAEVYSGYLNRWTKTLESCHIDSCEYRSREVEFGAENFVPCRQWGSAIDGTNWAMNWSVRLVFGQGDTSQELQMKFQFQSEDKDKVMPGAWPSGVVH